ncbi:MAG: glycosyl transferase, partial [Erysipelotrichia bacterium]|nr:glycosyl transferase [Erysipelotrichia bacterium]
MLKKLVKNVLPKKIIEELSRYKILKMQEANITLSNKEIEERISEIYLERFGREMHWDDPTTYTEKINISKLYNNDELRTTLADKLLVRNWVEEKIGEQYLVPLLGVYSNFDDIDFTSLPNEFVIKCNHDSGSVTICCDKKKLELKKLSKLYNDYYLQRNMAYLNFEMQYKNIKPK